MTPEPATEAGLALLNEHSRRPPLTDDGDPCAGERGVSRDHLRGHIVAIEREAAKIEIGTLFGYEAGVRNERDRILTAIGTLNPALADQPGDRLLARVLRILDGPGNRSSLISEESPDPQSEPRT